MPETCANCGRTIGNLETPFIYDEHIVCPECSARLSASTQLSPRHDPADALHAMVDSPIRQVNVLIAPPSPPPIYQQRPYVQTIEKTGKIWKLQILLSILICMTGTVLAVVGTQPHMEALTAIGGLMLVVGITWFIIARIGAWWNHG